MSRRRERLDRAQIAACGDPVSPGEDVPGAPLRAWFRRLFHRDWFRRYTGRVPDRPKKERPRERVRLTLDAPATPEHVREIAEMFANTIREIRPDLAEGDVTLVVKNFTSETELRGWQGEGVEAVKLFGDLVEDPTQAIQEDADLAPAARTLATHASKLVPYGPKFKRGRKKARAVDDIFVRTMRAAGTDALRAKIAASPGHLTGETIVYSPVIRVGQVSEGARLTARIKIEGKFDEVTVDDEHFETLFDVAKRRTVCQFRIRGRWEENHLGDLHLTAPHLVEINLDYSPWTGREILKASHELKDVFTAQDFERMLTDLQPDDMG